MSDIFFGLNPVGTQTGCFFQNKKPKKDIYLSQFIHEKWSENLSFIESISATYQVLVGAHHSFSTSDDDFFKQDTGQVKSFKGILDFLILPLIARQLWNWSWLKMLGEDRPWYLELAISAARCVALLISTARILMGIALTLLLSPIVALVSLVRLCLPHLEKNDDMHDKLEGLMPLDDSPRPTL